MLALVVPPLNEVLDPMTEEAYLTAMAAGKYQPELLFADYPEVAKSIARHPALLWKATNVAAHLAKRPKSK